MNQTIAIIGIGEMGGVFARGFLRCGYPLYPITRSMSIADTAIQIPNPVLVLVAVGENDLANVLAAIPENWRDRLGLLQNELLPGDWQRRHINSPTVISVWFEKKKGRAVKVLMPSPVYGPQADIIKESLNSLDIPSRRLASEQELLLQLVLKNLFILTLNIAGLKTGGTVAHLWDKNNRLARSVALEVIELQEWLVQSNLPRERLLADLEKAIHADPNHNCIGRSAPARCDRVIQMADKAGLAVPAIRDIHTGLNL
ncbi:MAG: hypothetical protein R3274_04280 [Desulfobacterales bacterium]|nr:hypothetical protein [Desulfobacterales bacterium]